MGHVFCARNEGTVVNHVRGQSAGCGGDSGDMTEPLSHLMYVAVFHESMVTHGEI